VRYERPPPAFDLDAACREVEDAIVALVPGAVAESAVGGSAACVALSYSPDDARAFEITIATPDERAALARIGAEAGWNPA
jgi:hypothetical protein